MREVKKALDINNSHGLMATSTKKIETVNKSADTSVVRKNLKYNANGRKVVVGVTTGLTSLPESKKD